MKRLGLAIVIMAAMALSVAYADSPDSAATCTVDVAVTGMSCGGGCPPKVTKALTAVKGVKSVKVSFEDKIAAVKASGAVCTPKGATALVAALKKAGYGGSIKKITQGAKPKATH